MGMFDIFKKKKEEEGFGTDFSETTTDNSDDENTSFSHDDLGMKPRFNESESPAMFNEPVKNNSGDKDMQLIIAKLDTINQRLELIDRRLQDIERLAKE